MKIDTTKNNTHITNSYKVQNRKSIRNEVVYIKEQRKILRYPTTRTDNSYIREWVGHNRLYNLGLFRKHTKDCDIQEPSNLLNELIWLILGGI